MKKQFCSYCGTKLDEGARFCKNCGAAVPNDAQNAQKTAEEHPSEKRPPERKTVYEGTIHKCPNCGEVLDSFCSSCPTCGYELRDVSSSSSIHELTRKLEEISSQKMPAYEEKKSVLKKLVGKDFKKEDEAKEMQKRFEQQKQQEMASLISNFTIPNSREDILEFLILAASNIDTKNSMNDDVTTAWITKLDQVYQKAELSMRDHPDFVQVKSIYDRKKQEIKIKKMKDSLLFGGVFVFCFFVLGMLRHPIATIVIIFGAFVVGIVAFVLFKRWQSTNKRE